MARADLDQREMAKVRHGVALEAGAVVPSAAQASLLPLADPALEVAADGESLKLRRLVGEARGHFPLDDAKQLARLVLPGEAGRLLDALATAVPVGHPVRFATQVHGPHQGHSFLTGGVWVEVSADALREEAGGVERQQKRPPLASLTLTP